GAPLNELAKIHGTAKSTITGIVDTMEKNGLVYRDRGSQDRRVILIRLTKKGKKMQNKTVDLSAITNKCCANIKRQEVKRLRNLLARFNRQITV
ncbi:MAG: MarR family winged helix-turn-helix transcriptional regulator, partial [bacterium]